MNITCVILVWIEDTWLANVPRRAVQANGFKSMPFCQIIPLRGLSGSLFTKGVTADSPEDSETPFLHQGCQISYQEGTTGFGRRWRSDIVMIICHHYWEGWMLERDSRPWPRCHCGQYRSSTKKNIIVLVWWNIIVIMAGWFIIKADCLFPIMLGRLNIQTWESHGHGRPCSNL